MQTDPALRDIIRMVGYLGMPVPITEERYKQLLAKYDKERLVKASQELIDIDTEKKLATIRAEVRKHCVAILGPAPEDWDTYYEGILNAPPNPYTNQVPVEKPADMSSEALIEKLDDAGLKSLLEDARCGLNQCGSKSRKARGFKKDIAMAEAEIARRAEEMGMVAHAVADAIQEETGMGCEVRQQEGKTTLVVKEKPTEAAGFIDFTTATTHRLKELLDMYQYEQTRSKPGTVTFDDAGRDIGLIEQELRRRETEPEAPDDSDLDEAA
jgi:hypothetical protein